MKVNKILNGDCIDHLKELPENSFDAIITDPPYGLEFMGKEWDKLISGKGKWGNDKEHKPTIETKKDSVQHRMNVKQPAYLKKCIKCKGNSSGEWNRCSCENPEFRIPDRIRLGGQEFHYSWAIECLRVLKPGGFLLSFGGTRTYHRLVCGIEDAGFEIRDTIMWLYGSGFPKSLNIGKQIDKIQGNERESVGTKQHAKKDFKDNLYAQDPANRNNERVFGYGEEELTKGNSEWEGWGTALKPACEPIVVARKPLSEKNVALNVLKWGTGGINIDESRIETNPELDDMLRKVDRNKRESEIWDKGSGFKNENNSLTGVRPDGRFPANIILDEEAGKMLDEQSGKTSQGHFNSKVKMVGHTLYEGGFKDFKQEDRVLTDKGGASRFFYCAKASKGERNLGCEEMEDKYQVNAEFRPNHLEKAKQGDSGKPHGRYTPTKNNHPTVKPIKLMEYLIKLVTREGALVLDPFLGSGTTAIACYKTNRNWIGIEKEKEYIKIAEARIEYFTQQKKLVA